MQFYALLWLDGVPRKSPSQLSRDLLCDRSNMTRVADTLERKGFVTRLRDSDDRRVTWLILTPRGEELCRQARREHTRYTHSRMSVLSDAEQSQLQQLLLSPALASAAPAAQPLGGPIDNRSSLKSDVCYQIITDRFYDGDAPRHGRSDPFRRDGAGIQFKFIKKSSTGGSAPSPGSVTVNWQ